MKTTFSLNIFLAFLATYVIWGSTYLCNKIVLQELPPFFAAGIRFTLAGIIITLILLFDKKNWKLTSLELKNATIAGTLFLTLGNGGVMWALQYVDSGFTALLISAQPLVLLIMMLIHYRQRIHLLSWVGVTLGIIGIYLLVSQNNIVSTSNQWLGILVIVGCLIAWGYGSLFVKQASLPRNYFLNAGIQMMVGGLSLLLFSGLLGENWMTLVSISSETIWVMIYLAIFGSIIAFTSFNFLLKHVSPEKVATNTYVNPIVAMVLGWWILDELITKQSIIAAVILLIGVYFINSVKSGPGTISTNLSES